MKHYDLEDLISALTALEAGRKAQDIEDCLNQEGYGAWKLGNLLRKLVKEHIDGN